MEKFAINSVISATHTSQMDDEDKNDIIKKVNSAGSNEENTDDNQSNDSTDQSSNDVTSEPTDNVEDELSENLFLKEPKKNNMFQDGSNDILKNINENHQSLNYMFWQNLKTIHHATGELLQMNQEEIDALCANGHAWAVDHIATSSDDIEEVYHFFSDNNDDSMDYYGDTENGYEDEYGSVEDVDLYEGKYDDKPLGKPMRGDVKKFKVYVKNKKGNVIKVNFGDPNMEIKRDDPKRKKSFRARHKCDRANDRTTPKYWSCKMWSKTPVSKIVGENLVESEKNSTFDKKLIKAKLLETFKTEDMNAEPITKPKVAPSEPIIKPSRRNKPFLPSPSVSPDPKAEK